LAVWRPAPDADDGRTVRVKPELDGGRFPRVLEGRYQLTAWRTEGGRANRWEFTAVPPRLRGAVYVGPGRWCVGLPTGVIPLVRGAAQPEWHWHWQGGLFVPQSARAVQEVDEWFRAGLTAGAEGDSEAPPGEAGWTVRQAALEPLRLALVPRAVWLPAC